MGMPKSTIKQEVNAKPSIFLHYLIIITVFLGLSLTTHALPQGGVVTDGQATITSGPSHTQINQSSNSAVYNWQSFNIDTNESTHFQQPGASSTAINRINGANGASKIFGKLTSIALWLMAELVIIKNMSNRKIISVIEAILNSALTLFFRLNSIVI